MLESRDVTVPVERSATPGARRDSGTAAISLLAALRTRTGAQHERLDAALAVTSDITLPRYDAFLRASLAVIEVVEPAVEALLGGFDGPSRRERLRADLAAVAARGSVAPSDPAVVEIRRPASVAEAFGCAYVLEGSTLGGVVLARTVEPALDLAAREGTSYLRLRGERTGELWRAFLVRLERFDAEASAGDRDAACEYAASTFEAYSEAFRRVGAVSR